MAKPREATVTPRERKAPLRGSAAVRGMRGSARDQVFFAGAVLVLAVILAHWNGVRGVLLFDDLPAIAQNSTIRHLGPQVFSPPKNGETVSGRPLLNLSFAINYAISEAEPWSYHIVNIAVHACAALLLMGIVRRTLRKAAESRLAQAATSLSFAAALVWALHPMQTAAVTYVVQRAESLMALLYLLTLYCAVRGMESSRPGGWYAAAIVACFLGAGVKEVIVTAPVVVLLYDRTFVAGSFREALRRRWHFYTGLLASWLLLGWLVISAQGRGGTAGIGQKIGVWAYLRTQWVAIVHYLRLSIWPAPLVMEYGTAVESSLVKIITCGTILAILLAGTVWAFIRRHWLGFVGAAFFLILAPSSSVVPVITQTKAEHRMYLPLAAVVALVGAGALRLAMRWAHQDAPRARSALMAGVAIVGLLFGILTARRNADFSSMQRIWEDTVAKAPLNPRPHSDLGAVLMSQHKYEESRREFLRALELDPQSPVALTNYGMLLTELNQLDEAERNSRRAVEIAPVLPVVQNNLGAVLHRQKKLEEALACYRKAAQLDPLYSQAENNIGNALFCQHKFEEAIPHYQRAAELDPKDAEPVANIGDSYRALGRHREAIPWYEKALARQPAYVPALDGLGWVLYAEQRYRESVPLWRRWMAAQPGAPMALIRLAWVLSTCPDPSLRNGSEALQLAQQAYQLTGGQDPGALDAQGAALAENGRFGEAAKVAEEAARIAAQKAPGLVDSIRIRQRLYESGQPFRTQ